jgi:hypothetical protein
MRIVGSGLQIDGIPGRPHATDRIVAALEPKFPGKLS